MLVAHHVQFFATPWRGLLSVHGILQARILEWVAIPFSILTTGPWVNQQGASSSSAHTQKGKTKSSRERSGGLVELHVCRPHSSCCRQRRLTQGLMLSYVRSTVTLTVALLQPSSITLTLSGASSWTAWPHWGRTCIWNFPGEDISQSHLKD